MSMASLRERTQEYEEKNDTKVICKTSGYPCLYCPLCVSGFCPHLKKFLKKGKWD
jgi:hypothetical protein